MKKILTLMLALLPVVAAVAQKSSLTVALRGAAEGTKMVVCEAQGGRLVPADTVAPDGKGRFVVRRDATEPQFFAMVLDRPQSPMIHVILLPKEKVTLEVNYDDAYNQLRIASVKGSDNMELYRRFNNLMADAAIESSLQATAQYELEQMLGENSGVLMSAFLVTFFETAFDQYAGLYKQIRDALVDEYPNNDFVRHLNDKLRTAVVVGMEAPDIALPDRDGQVRRLSDLRGKVVLIDFWASWCRPCRMENPNVVRLYHRFHDKGFEIYSVSLDNSREKWLAAIESDGLVWQNHVSDLKGWQSAGGRLYGINSIPATVLIDAEGKVLARNLRGAELEQKLTEILQQ